MPHISLITSTYQAEPYFRAYIDNVRELGNAFADSPLELELVIIANDANRAEYGYLDDLERLKIPHLSIKTVYVPRESVYTSWNRGVREASAPMISFWGIDDYRYAQPLITGYHMLKNGCELVYFPYQVMTSVSWGLFKSHNQAIFPARNFNPKLFARRMSLGPFWMTTKDFYTQVGTFDEHFKVCGDFEWCQRALKQALFCPCQELGGRFIIHGDNLSANTNPLKIVEENIIYLRYGLEESVRPADPALMQACWETWGAQGQQLSAETRENLWGAGAKERQEQWLKEWHAKQRSENLRRIPRMVMNRLGLRSVLAKLGVVKSAK